MNRTNIDWIGRAFLVVFVCCAGYMLVRAYVMRPISDSVQWKIDRLKARMQASERDRNTIASIEYAVPRNAEGTMVRCLLLQHATPIQAVIVGGRRLTANRCSVEVDDSMARIMCPASARRVAESCAASIR